MEQYINQGLYIHVPFCDKFCTFCKYKHQISQQEKINKHHEHIIRTIEENKSFLGSEMFDELYFGGGTPTTLSANQFRQILDKILDDGIAIDKWMCEGSPSTITDEHIEMFIEYDFDYISMGIQSFDPKVLKKINRDETPIERIKYIVNHLQYHGIIVNLDLICGLDNGDVTDVEGSLRDMDTAIDIGANSITMHVNYDEINKLEMRRKLLEELTDHYEDYMCVNHDMSTEPHSILADAKYKAEYKFMNKKHHFFHRQTGAIPYAPEYKWRTYGIYEDYEGLYERSTAREPAHVEYQARLAYEVTKRHRDKYRLYYY